MVVPTVGAPTSPQELAISDTAATFTTPISKYYTLKCTIACFFTVDGTTPTASGATAHYLGAGGAIDLWANPNTVVKVISSDSNSGYAYITQYSGMGV